MKTTRKRYSADFKAKVTLEAIRGDLTLGKPVQRIAAQVLLNDLALELQAVGSMSHCLFSKSQTHGQS